MCTPSVTVRSLVFGGQGREREGERKGGRGKERGREGEGRREERREAERWKEEGGKEGERREGGEREGKNIAYMSYCAPLNDSKGLSSYLCLSTGSFRASW